ncbi:MULTISPECIES: GNAT family N-acetyltransferase [unclassified Paenibacillus]|uniref:GNAT family N-acetyltransferase n=1 Tax=unclassified Paenibacillus TaxID=185978 RepID=UPI002F424B32
MFLATKLTNEQWMLEKGMWLAFIVRHGRKKITKSAFRALQQLDPNKLVTNSDGRSPAVIAAVRHQGKPIALGFADNYGMDGCFIVAHSEAGGRGAGSAIMNALLQSQGKLTCNVAADNIASMALCFKFGFKAVQLHKGPTGKSTLRFERGFQDGSASTWHSNALS